MSTKFEAKKTDGKAAVKDGFARTIVYHDAKKQGTGADPIAERLAKGMEVEYENHAFTMLKEPAEARAERIDRESRVFDSQSGSAADKEGLVRNVVETGTDGVGQGQLTSDD